MSKIYITPEFYNSLSTWQKIKFWFKVWGTGVEVREITERERK